MTHNHQWFANEILNASKVIKEAFEAVGCPQLSGVVTVEFNNRFKRRAGDAIWKSVTKVGKIRLSMPLWPHMSEADRKNTIVHEAAHIVVGYRYGQAKQCSTLGSKPYVFIAKPKSHGIEWKQTMLAMGEQPTRTHDLDTYKLGISKKRQQYEASCACMTHTFGPTIARRMATKTYYCTKCKQPIDSGTLKKKEVIS